MNPDNLALTLEQLEPELSQLIGDEQWALLYPKYTLYRDQLQTDKSRVVRLQAAAELIELLSSYELVQTRLRVAMDGLNVYQTALVKLATIARQLNTESKIVAELEDAAAFHSHGIQTRLIALHGIGQKAQSIKWQNFDFDFGDAPEMAETVAGILAVFSDIINTNSNHLLMAAGALLIIRSILKATTIEISEQDASVFWGVIQAQRHHVPSHITTTKVVEHTNSERAKAHLPPLSEQEVRYALYNLVKLKSVTQLSEKEEVWWVIEKYKSKV